MAGEIFISYRRADERFARFLYDRLKAEGVEAWYDAHVGAGEDWRTSTARALQGARIFVLLFSRAAAASDDISKELAAATFSKKLVVPVRLEDIQPEGAFLYELAGRNWIDAFQETEAKLGEVARSLAELVKSGKQDPAMLPFNRGMAAGPKRSRPKPHRLIAVSGFLLALVVAAAIGVVVLKGQPKAPGVNQRFAFFGFTVSDPALQAAADAATSTMVATMSGEHMDIAPQSETKGTPEVDQLKRATALGAQYALSGEVHAADDQIVATTRMVDAPSKTVIWTDSVKAPQAAAALLAERAASQAVPIIHCTADWRQELSRDRLDLVGLMPAGCENITTWGPSNLASWRKLATGAPEAADIQSSFVAVLATARAYAGLSGDANRLAEAEASLKKIQAIDPKSSAAYRARMSIATWKNAPLGELESLLNEALAAWPSDSWINYNMAAFRRAVGQLKDAVGPAQVSYQSDPLSPLKETYYGRALLASGAGPEQGRELMLHALEAKQFAIALYIVGSDLTYKDPETAERLIPLRPTGIPADGATCASAMVVAVKARRAGKALPPESDPLKVCPAGTPGQRMDGLFTYLVYIGDTKAAFDLPHFPLPLGEQMFLYAPETKAARADPRFKEIADYYGLTRYWKESGRLPDFCETEKVPICDEVRSTPR